MQFNRMLAMLQTISIDNIEFTYMNYKDNRGYNSIKLLLQAFDVNENPLYGSKVTGEIYCYSL